ncbi:MAG: formylglycine-generating enzyme family protein [Spirochaetia bacterium]|jgi:formylglycine-generating enzyme required for sulfatase activity|nr:formylglycine-generating enzyme family protein [Spirochaetia bacterium]
MKEEKKITQADIDGAKVQLGPLAGISPRVYLPLTYALGLLLILFLLLVLPGIRKYGSYLEFSGQPSPSAVFNGDDYKGSSEQRIFFPAGSYELRIEHDGFAPQNLNVKVAGRLFGSLFFPRKQTVDYSLQTGDAAAYLQKSYAEYSAWSMSGKPSALYQIPAVLSEAAGNLARTGVLNSKNRSVASPGASPAAPAGASQAAPGAEPARSDLPSDRDFARDLASAGSSAESARDGLRASIIYSSSGIVSPLSLSHSARTIVSALGVSTEPGTYLQDLAPALAPKITAALGSATGQTEAGATAAPAVKGRKSLAGQDFILFSQGSFRLGGEAPSGSRLPYRRDLPAFGLAVAEVSNRQWALFMKENPEWSLERKATLAGKGLVDEDYLAGWKAADDLPVTGISWFAASAYCEWLSSKSGGYRFGLPSEAMWEAAARTGLADDASASRPAGIWSDGRRSGPVLAGSAGYDKSGIADLFGNVWEWNSDSYRPYPAFAANKLQTAERSVRGGSWANKPGSVNLYSRGALEPSRCTAYLGFRPALLNP